MGIIDSVVRLAIKNGGKVDVSQNLRKFRQSSMEEGMLACQFGKIPPKWWRAR